MRLFHHEVDIDEVESLLRQHDRDGDGVIDFVEFLGMMACDDPKVDP